MIKHLFYTKKPKLCKCKKNYAKMCGIIFTKGKKYLFKIIDGNIIVFGKYNILFDIQEFNFYFCRNRK